MTGRAAALASLATEPLPTPTGLADTYFASFDAVPADPTSPQSAPPTNPPSSPTDPSAPANTQSGNGGGSTSLVVIPPTPPSSNVPQAPSTPPPVVPPPTSLPMNPPTPPQANDDNYSVVGGSLTVSAASGLLANDTNPTGQPMTAQLVNAPVYGSVSLNADGSFTYTNNDPGLTQTVTFTYVASAGGLVSYPATVTLTLPPLLPVANDDAYTVTAGVLSVPASGVLANDLVFPVQPMSAMLVSNASNGIVMLNRDGSFEYDATPGYLGTDSFTYQATTSNATSNIATVTLNVVAPVSPLTLTNPGPQANAVGDTVSLQLQTSAPTGATLTYAATNLPSGLTIDPSSGLISGAVDSSDAVTAGGHYSVTVTVTDDYGQTASQTFAWTISIINRPPLLAAPGIQNNEVGDAVSLQLVGSDPDGDTLTYSAVGLPAGLSIDPATGLISGVLTAAPGAYNGTATVSDGSLSASAAITWNVISGATVTFAINNTIDHSDDVLLWGAGTIPVTVTLTNAGAGLHEVQLSAPTGQVSINDTNLELLDGESYTVWLTALQLSQADDDTLLNAVADGKAAGQAKLAVVGVTLPAIRNADTPAGMKDRIPPRVSTNLAVVFSLPIWTSGKVIKFTVENQNANNGTTDIAAVPANPFLPLPIMALNLYGRTQTVPGNAGNLTVKVQVGNIAADSVQSAGFSVAAIPVSVRMFRPTLAAGKDTSAAGDANYVFMWGTVYQVAYVSDSGFVEDLDQVKVSEKIRLVASSKGYSPVSNVSGFLAVEPTSDDNTVGRASPKTVDGQAVSVDNARRKAVQDFQNGVKAFPGQSAFSVKAQYSVFIDNRTGATDEMNPLFVTNSGFQITSQLGVKAGKVYVTVTKIAVKLGNGVLPGLMSATASKPFADEVK